MAEGAGAEAGAASADGIFERARVEVVEFGEVSKL